MPVRRPAVAPKEEEKTVTVTRVDRTPPPPVRRSTRAKPSAEIVAPPVEEEEGTTLEEEIEISEVPWEEDSSDERPSHSGLVQRGWKAADEMAKSAVTSGEWINDFRWKEEAALLRFLDNRPMSFKQHWVERPVGKRGFVCVGKDCPLCDSGNTPSAKFAFSVVCISDETEYLLVVGKRMLKELESRDKDSRTGPLTRSYWAASSVGGSRSIIPVKARDLDEDWGTTEAEAQAIYDRYEAADASAIFVNSREELAKVAHPSS